MATYGTESCVCRRNAGSVRPSRRPYGPPQGERIRERIYEMLHYVKEEHVIFENLELGTRNTELH